MQAVLVQKPTRAMGALSLAKAGLSEVLFKIEPWKTMAFDLGKATEEMREHAWISSFALCKMDGERPVAQRAPQQKSGRVAATGERHQPAQAQGLEKREGFTTGTVVRGRPRLADVVEPCVEHGEGVADPFKGEEFVPRLKFAPKPAPHVARRFPGGPAIADQVRRARHI